jgi:serine/threonine protein kinase
VIEEIEMMKDEELKENLQKKLDKLEDKPEDEGGWPYYSDEKLEKVSLQDIFSAGVLVLECVQNISEIKKKQKLEKKTLNEILEICEENYSNYFNTLIKKMIEFDPENRWNIKQVQSYLGDIFCEETTIDNSKMN